MPHSWSFDRKRLVGTPHTAVLRRRPGIRCPSVGWRHGSRCRILPLGACLAPLRDATICHVSGRHPRHQLGQAGLCAFKEVRAVASAVPLLTRRAHCSKTLPDLSPVHGRSRGHGRLPAPIGRPSVCERPDSRTSPGPRDQPVDGIECLTEAIIWPDIASLRRSLVARDGAT